MLKLKTAIQAQGDVFSHKSSFCRILFVLVLFNSFAFTFGQNCVPPPPDIQGWWDGDGNADDRVRGNSANLNGGVSFGLGEVGQGFLFDGSSGFVSIPAAAQTDIGAAGGLTVECWIQPSQLSSGQVIAEWNDGNGNIGTHLMISIPELGGLGSIFANLRDENGLDHYFATSANVLSLNNYQHVALTYDKSSGAAHIFLNGTSVASADLGVFTPETSYSLNLGKRVSGNGTGQYFSGILDEFSIYNRALTASEVSALNSAASGGKCKDVAPVIQVQPSNQHVRAGYSAVFNVVVSGSPLAYQWRYNNSEIPGETSSSLVLPHVQTNQAGLYSVIITNSWGSVVSSDALLEVDPNCLSAASGIVSWWPADGDADDHVGENQAAVTNNLAFISGLAGQAFSFNGTNTFIQFLASPSLNVGTGTGMTIEGWIKPSILTRQQAIAEWNNGQGQIGVQFMHSIPSLGGAGSLFVNLLDTSGGNHSFTTGAQALTTSAFQHVAVTYDKSGGVARIFVNGKAIVTQTLGVFTPQTSYDLYFGTRASGPGAGSFYSGLIDEFTIYNRALSTNEIEDVFNATSFGKACIPPEILVQPLATKVKSGSNATFQVTVRGAIPLRFQWYRGENPIPNATNRTLLITNATLSSATNYSVRVTNYLGFAISSNAALNVSVVYALANGRELTNSTATFSAPVGIQFQTVFTDGLIFYTLDGSKPDINSTFYTGPFSLTNGVVLRALAYSSDFLQSGEMDPVTIFVVPSYRLSATILGGGTVSLNPPGSNYLSNTTVTVSALPNAGWKFLQWLGDASGTNPVTNVTMNRSKVIQPVFGTSLHTTIAGSGSVILDPPGGTYPFGTGVTLSAIPQQGSYFGFWGNAATGNTNPLSFVITNSNPTISALFQSLGSGQAALTVSPVGKGTITVNPRANVYTIGQTITITAIPGTNEIFLGWSGDVVGSANPLTIQMDQSKVIYADFTHAPVLSIIKPYDGPKPEGFAFTISSDFGTEFSVQASTNLLDWTTLSVISNAFGAVGFTDPGATNLNMRYYRVEKTP